MTEGASRSTSRRSPGSRTGAVQAGRSARAKALTDGVESATPARIAAKGPVGFVTSLPKQTTDVDRMVGLRIACLRKAKGLSQTALGQAIGVTFQQVQKYEKGQNRVGAGRLRDIAQLLEVPVSSFFDEDGAKPAPAADDLGFLRLPGAIDLLRSFAAITDDQVRRDLVALSKSLAKALRA